MPLWVWIVVGLLPSLPFVLPVPRTLRFLRTRQLRKVVEETRHRSVSIVITAKDEAESIEACLEAARSNPDPSLQLIVVNDRSEDETGSIIDAVAMKDSRIHVVHVTELPGGWLGKCHALTRGAEHATGDYVLLMDGDIVLSSDVLDLAVTHMQNQDLDHLTLLPGTLSEGLLERAFLAYFIFSGLAALRVWDVRKPGRAFAGFGSFNLVKRSSYEARGGHEAVRLEVVDDILLGGVMKTEGGRSDVLVATDDVCVRWHPGARALIAGMEKNGFAVCHFSLPVALAVFTFPGLCAFGPLIAALLLGDARGVGFVGGSLLFHLSYGVVSRMVGLGLRVTPFLLFAIPFMGLALARSTWVTVRQRGVRWRGTFYPIEELRTAHRALWRRVRTRSESART